MLPKRPRKKRKPRAEFDQRAFQIGYQHGKAGQPPGDYDSPAYFEGYAEGAADRREGASNL